MRFPFPFSGITHTVMLTGLHMDVAVGILSGTPKTRGGCGHKHNFAVAAGAKTIYTTALGAQCLQDGFEARRRKEQAR